MRPRPGAVLAALLLFALAAACMPVARPAASGAPAPATGTAASTTAGASTLTKHRLAVARDAELAVIEGGRERVIAHARDTNNYIAYPRWSPDGSQVAFVEAASLIRLDGDWGDDVFVATTADGSVRLLRPHVRGGEQLTGLDWTADGRALVLGVRQMRLVDGRINGFDYSVQRYDLDRDSSTTIVDGGVEPSLSGDGGRLVYVRVTDTGTLLYVANADGSQPRQVPLQPRPLFVFSPRLSRDGKTVAFGAPSPDAQGSRRAAEGPLRTLLRLGARPAEAHGVPMEVWRASVETGAVERVSSLLDDEPRPAWSDDGSVFVIATGALYEVGPAASVAKAIAPGQFGGNIDVAPGD